MQPKREAPPRHEDGEQNSTELDRLRNTSDSAVGRASSKVAGLTSEEEDNRRRSHRDSRRAAWAGAQKLVIYSLAVIGIILAVCFALLVVAIIARWVGITFRDSKKVDDLVRGALWTLLVAGTTSWANGFLKRDD